MGDVYRYGKIVIIGRNSSLTQIGVITEVIKQHGYLADGHSRGSSTDHRVSDAVSPGAFTLSLTQEKQCRLLEDARIGYGNTEGEPWLHQK